MIPFVAPLAGLVVTLLASLCMYRLGIRVGRAQGVQQGTQLARAHELRLEGAIERDAWLRAYCAALTGLLSGSIMQGLEPSVAHLCVRYADDAIAVMRRPEDARARYRRLAGD